MDQSEHRPDDLRSAFEKELEALSKNSVLNPGYRRRKLLLWLVRNSLSAILYVVFWEHEWVRWTLFLTVPLSLLSLASIIGMSHLLGRRIERTRRKLEEADRLAMETTDDRQTPEGSG